MKPIRTISIAVGTGGKGFAGLRWELLLKSARLTVDCRNFLPRLVSLALMGPITLLMVWEIGAEVSAAHKPAVKMASWCVTVGEAFAAEAANSRNVIDNNLLTRKSTFLRAPIQTLYVTNNKLSSFATVNFFVIPKL